MSLRRRSIVYGGVATAAATTGIAYGLWRRQRPAADTVADLWNMRFAQPHGGELSMASLRGRPLVLNFWASWCAPCVREMPQLDRFHRVYAPKWRVVGLAIDNLSSVQGFLKRTPVAYQVALAGSAGTDLMRRLGNTQGMLPFTVFFNQTGSAVRTRLGEITFDELVTWVADA